MMPNCWPIGLLSLFITIALHAQTPYFQQQTDFTLTATLDDQRHLLHGQWVLDYTNHSPDTLTFLFLHLWPNAYANRTTAFAQQMLNNGDTKFYFALDSDLGYIDSLAFEQAGTPLSITPTDMGPDVVKVALAQPLLPGGQCRITTPFRVKFPDSFSRLGHVGQSYQATQWYPKPAVYDRDGWHPMPYLDYGEFYSEFGNYDVTIHLPANYRVGATGQLQTAAERQALLQQAAQTAQLRWSDTDPKVEQEPPFPPSDAAFKTLRYTAEGVHDFAWFADKRFHVLHDTLHLGGSEAVDVWTFFTDREAHLWQESARYTKRATRFYSDQVGAYPYPQVTAVQSALSAGGGMEYPMVTVIGLSGNAPALDIVIAHEVGHNWFYGMLATNERDHAWLDEGFNSYYEQRYTQAYYRGGESYLPAFLQSQPPLRDNELGYRYYGCQHRHQAPATTSGDMRSYNYWVGAYSAPALALAQLEHHWGTARLDSAMQHYFRTWQHRHPQPQDAQAALEHAGGEPLDWLFGGFIATTGHQDYALRRVEYKDETLVTIQNKGQIAGPFALVGITASGDTTTLRHAGFIGTETFALGSAAYQSIHIDPHHQTMDMHRHNHHWRTGLWGLHNPPKLRLVMGIKNENRSDLFLLPLGGYNVHDGTMGGIGIHNRGLLPQRLEWLLAPMFSTQTSTLVGMAGLRWRHWFTAGHRIRELALAGSYRRFHFDTFEAQSLPLRYARASVVAQVRFHQQPRQAWEKSAWLRYLNTTADDLVFGTDGTFMGTQPQQQQIYEGALRWHRPWALSPATVSPSVGYARYTDDFNRQQQYLKLQLEAHGKVLYEPGRAFHWRLFGGAFLYNTVKNTSYTPAPAFSLFDRGREDYRYDNLYFDRSATNGWGARQLGLRDGGFRAPIPTAFGLGRSNVWMTSLNASLDLPLFPRWLPIKPYLDAAYYAAPNFSTTTNTFLWTGGVALEWMDGQVGIYLPLVGSPDVMDRLREQGGTRERIAFRLLLTRWAPWNWMDDVRF